MVEQCFSCADLFWFTVAVAVAADLFWFSAAAAAAAAAWALQLETVVFGKSAHNWCTIVHTPTEAW